MQHRTIEKGIMEGSNFLTDRTMCPAGMIKSLFDVDGAERRDKI
jgi:hypothetical protein